MGDAPSGHSDVGFPGLLTDVDDAPDRSGSPGSVVDRLYAIMRTIPTGVLWLLVIVWSIPALGVTVDSFRDRRAQLDSGWWSVAPSQLTLDNFDQLVDARPGVGPSLVNSMRIAIPATIIPIAIAALAAYGFARIDFRGRKALYVATVSLVVVPAQAALIPLRELYDDGAEFTLPLIDRTITLVPDFDLAGTTTAVWLAHAGFVMPFAVFLLHNHISSLPDDVFDAARIDGASHATVFWRLVLPLSVPALAALATLQFLWTWNDFLVADTMVGTDPDQQPTTVLIADLASEFGRNEHVLPAAALVQAVVPLVVFFALRRHLVRGVLGASGHAPMHRDGPVA